MAKNRAEAIADLLAVLFEAFGRSATPVTFKAYTLGLEGIEESRIREAALAAIKTCKFCPSPAELRELAGVATAKQRAELAFLAFDAAVTRHGAYRTVSFDDPLINAVARSLGGWVRACDMNAEEFAKWYRKSFLETYERLATTDVNSDCCRPLPGLPSGSPKVIAVVTGLPWSIPVAPGISDQRGAASGLLELRRP